MKADHHLLGVTNMTYYIYLPRNLQLLFNLSYILCNLLYSNMDPVSFLFCGCQKHFDNILGLSYDYTDIQSITTLMGLRKVVTSPLKINILLIFKEDITFFLRHLYIYFCYTLYYIKIILKNGIATEMYKTCEIDVFNSSKAMSKTTPLCPRGV